MIKFTFGLETRNKRFKELVWFQLKPVIVLGIISTLYTLYFMIIGFFFDSEALETGIPMCFITSILFLSIFAVTFKIRKQINEYYNKQKDKGMIELQISRNGDEFKWESLSKGSVIVFSKEDIVRRKIGKNFLIVKLKSNLIFDFPKQDDILKLFE